MTRLWKPVALALAIALCLSCGEPEPEAIVQVLTSPTPTPDVRATVVAEITATAMARPTDTPTASPTPDVRATVVAEITATAMAQPTDTSTPTPTAAPEPTPTFGPVSMPIPFATLTVGPLRTRPTPIVTGTPTRTATHTVTPIPTRVPNAAKTPMPSLKGTVTPTPTSEIAASQVMHPSEIYAKVSPSIAFISTTSSYGSGILIEGGYIVTNAHVVWPYNNARVVLPGGPEHPEVPVVGWDHLVDLAVLGPIDGGTDWLELVNGEKLPIGADVFLIGYPGEVESSPQPTITRGVISRLREWDPVGVTYFQTDASIAGGQSGGALVSDGGDVVGISGFTFSEADFALAASSADALPRIRELIAGQDPSELGERQVLPGGGPRQHRVTLSNFWDQGAFVIDQPASTVVDLEVTGDEDLVLRVYDLFGYEMLAVDESDSGTEFGSVTIEYAEPHFLVVWQGSEEPSQITVESSHSLTPLVDPDDGRVLDVGQSIHGNIDYLGDADHFWLRLTEGETVEIVTRAYLFDPFLLISYPGADDDEIIIDDDSGGGFAGLDSKIVYRSPHTGRFAVVVNEPSSPSTRGGYILTVSTLEGDPTLTSTTRASLFE